MSGVVLRCPNCGTTKATPGECQACHEADVRYYCTNHTPGQWLAAAACPTCGAKFGDPAPRPAPAPSPRTPSSPPASPARKRSVPGLPERAGGPWARRTRRPAREEAGGASYGSGADPRIGSWPDLLREAALRARRMRSEAKPGPDPVAVGAAFSGCLIRGVFLILMMLVAFVLLSVLAGSFFLQGF